MTILHNLEITHSGDPEPSDGRDHGGISKRRWEEGRAEERVEIAGVQRAVSRGKTGFVGQFDRWEAMGERSERTKVLPTKWVEMP